MSRTPESPVSAFPGAIPSADSSAEIPAGPPSTVVAEAMLRAALAVTRDVAARHLFVYAHALPDLSVLARVDSEEVSFVLVTQGRHAQAVSAGPLFHVLAVPDVDLTRMGRIKTAMLLAYTEGLLEAGETFVCLTGEYREEADTLVVLRAGMEEEVLLAPGSGRKLRRQIKPAVFARVLNVCLALAGESREGKPIGTMFVVGDQRRAARFCRQLIINPFKGYPESARNILSADILETVRGFAALDGAFIVKGTGPIVSAGTYLAGLPTPTDDVAAGLGTRHRSAAGITAVTDAVAFVISESSGTVRVFRGGRMITEIERGHSMRSHRAGAE